MNKKVIFISIGVLVVLFIVASILIEGPNQKRMYLNIKNSSIPKEVSVGDVFTIELDTNLYKSNIAFASSDNDIISINNDGLATVLKKGTVTIYVSSVYEEKNPQQDSVKIKVK